MSKARDLANFGDDISDGVISLPTNNSVSLVASGAISTGAAVLLRSDGTVEVVAGQSEDLGTPVTITSTTTSIYENTAYDPVNNKVFVMYRDTTADELRLVAGDVTSSSITFGTPITVLSSASARSSFGYATIFDPVSGSFVYSHYNSLEYLTVRAASVSGTTITLGSPVTIYTGDGYFPQFAYDTTQQKIAMVYTPWVNQYTVYARVITVSGTTISAGSPFALFGSTESLRAFYFDESDGSFVLASAQFSTNYAMVQAFKVNGTSFTAGSAVALSTAVSNGVYTGDYSPQNQRGVVIFRSNSLQYATTVTVSNLSVSTPVAPYVTFNKNPMAHRVKYNPSTDSFISFIVSDSADGYKFYKANAAVVGGLVTFDAFEVITGYTVYENVLTYLPTLEKFLLTIRNSSNSLSAQVFTPENTNLTSLPFVGFSDGNYSNGEAVSVKTIGTVTENQTGLTAGNTYYVSGDGSLVTTQSESYFPLAGVALSDTKLLIKG